MSVGVLSYNNKNTEGFLGRIFGEDLQEGFGSYDTTTNPNLNTIIAGQTHHLQRCSPSNRSNVDFTYQDMDASSIRDVTTGQVRQAFQQIYNIGASANPRVISGRWGTPSPVPLPTTTPHALGKLDTIVTHNTRAWTMGTSNSVCDISATASPRTCGVTTNPYPTISPENTSQHLQIKVSSSPIPIIGVMTAGGLGDNRVLKYKVMSSSTDASDNSFDNSFSPVTPSPARSGMFENNFPNETTIQYFQDPITAKYIRFYPQKWMNYPSMKVGIIKGVNTCNVNSASAAAAAAGPATGTGFTCDNFFNSISQGRGSGTTIPTPSPGQLNVLKECPLYYPVYMDKPLCMTLPPGSGCPNHKISSVCTDDDCIIIKKMEKDISNKPSNHIVGVYKRIQDDVIKGGYSKDYEARNDNHIFRELQTILNQYGLIVEHDDTDKKSGQAWLRDKDSAIIYGDDYRELNDSIILQVKDIHSNKLWVIASTVDMDKYYGSTKLLSNEVKVEHLANNNIKISGPVVFINTLKNSLAGKATISGEQDVPGGKTINITSISQSFTFEGKTYDPGILLSDLPKELKANLERKWNIGFLMTGDEKYGWLDPPNDGFSVGRYGKGRPPLLGVVTHNLLSNKKKNITNKDYYQHLFGTGEIVEPTSSPVRKISSFPDFLQRSTETEDSHLSAIPKSEYYDTMRIVYIKPEEGSGGSDGSYKYLPPYIFNSDDSRYESVLYSIGPIWDPRRNQDVYQKYITEEMETCQRLSNNNNWDENSTVSNVTGEGKEWSDNRCKTLKTFPVVSELPISKDIPTLFNSMKASRDVGDGGGDYYDYKKDQVLPRSERLYNHVSGNKSSPQRYVRKVTELKTKSGAGGFQEETPFMKENGGFLEDCNYRACYEHNAEISSTVFETDTWYNNGQSPKKIYIGLGDKPCITTTGCNDPYTQAGKKCNGRTGSCKNNLCIIPDEVWRQKLGYNHTEGDKIYFEREKGKCLSGTDPSIVSVGSRIINDRRKGIYKNEKVNRMKTNKKDCFIKCNYSDIHNEEDCRLANKKWEQGPPPRCVDDKKSGGTYCDKNKIIWQKCDTSDNICNVEPKSYKSLDKFKSPDHYRKHTEHNIQIFDKKGNLSRCLPAKSFYKEDGTLEAGATDNDRLLENNKSCSPICHTEGEHINLPPTHSLNEFTGKIECKNGMNISNKHGDGVECKKRCFLPSTINNKLRNIPPVCKSGGANPKRNDKLIKLNTHLQQLFYNDPPKYILEEDKYKNICENSLGSPNPSPVYRPAPSEQPDGSPHPLCSNKTYLDVGSKCMYHDGAVYKTYECGNNQNLVEETMSPQAIDAKNCGKLSGGARASPIDLNGPIRDDNINMNGVVPQRSRLKAKSYTLELCGSTSPIKIKKPYGCTLAPTFTNTEQLTDEYIGRGCYQVSASPKPRLVEMNNRTLCSPSPLKFIRNKCYKKSERINPILSSNSAGFAISPQDKLNVNDKYILEDGTGSCSIPSDTIYDVQTKNAGIIISSPSAPYASVSPCMIRKVDEIKYGLSKQRCSEPDNIYMDIPKDSEVVQCPINSEHLGECTFKCKKGYDLFEKDKNVPIFGKNYFKSMCFHGKWIPYLKQEDKYKEVECIKKGCGYPGETIKFPDVRLAGYADNQKIKSIKIEAKRGGPDNYPWIGPGLLKGEKTDNKIPQNEAEMFCNSLQIGDKKLEPVDRRRNPRFKIICEDGNIKYETHDGTPSGKANIESICRGEKPVCFRESDPLKSCEVDSSSTLKPDYDAVDCKTSDNTNFTCGCKRGWYGSGYHHTHPNFVNGRIDGCDKCDGKRTSIPGQNYLREDCICDDNQKLNDNNECECGPGFTEPTANSNTNILRNKHDSHILKCEKTIQHKQCNEKTLGQKGSDPNKSTIFKWVKSDLNPQNGKCICKDSSYVLKSPLEWKGAQNRWETADKSIPKCIEAAINCKCPYGNASRNCKFIDKNKDNTDICVDLNTKTDCDKQTRTWYPESSASPGYCVENNIKSTPKCISPKNWNNNQCIDMSIKTKDLCSNICKFESGSKCKNKDNIYCDSCKTEYKETSEIINDKREKMKFCYTESVGCNFDSLNSDSKLQYFDGENSNQPEPPSKSSSCKDIVICGENKYIKQPGTKGSKTRCSGRCKLNEIAWTSTRRGDELDFDATKNKCKIKQIHSPYCEEFINIEFDNKTGLPKRNKLGVCNKCKDGNYELSKGQCFHTDYNRDPPSLSEYNKNSRENLVDKKEYFLFRIGVKSVNELPWNSGSPEVNNFKIQLRNKIVEVFGDYFKYDKINNKYPNFVKNFNKDRIKVEREFIKPVLDETTKLVKLLNITILIEPEGSGIKKSDEFTKDIIMEALNNDGEPIRFSSNRENYYIVGLPRDTSHITQKEYIHIPPTLPNVDKGGKSTKARIPVTQQLCSDQGNNCSSPPSDFDKRRCAGSICGLSDFSNSGACCVLENKSQSGKIAMDTSLQTLYNDVANQTRTSISRLDEIYKKFSLFMKTNNLQ